LDQEPSHCGDHEADAAELRHIRFDVGGIEPRLGNVQIKRLDEFRSDGVHSLLGQFIDAKQRDVSFDRTTAKALTLGLEVDRVLKVGFDPVGVSRFLVSPVAELHDEEQAGHRVQFFGGASHRGMKVFPKNLGGQQFQDNVARQVLPPAP
jgi:hypothetical protein